MKKLFLMLSAVGTLTFSLTSCGREAEPAIEQTFDVQLAANQSYTFVLPQNKRNDAYEFTTQASHYNISSLGTNTLGQQIYQYTPSLNYVGTDQVIVNNDWERNEEHQEHQGPPNGGSNFGNCTGGHGGCNGGEEDHYIVTINFNIRGAQTGDAK